MSELFSIVVTHLGHWNRPDFLKNYEVIKLNIIGRSRARNEGAKRAKNGFILFFDGDTSFSKEVLAFTEQFLREHPDQILCYRSEAVCSKYLAVSKSLFWKLRGFDETFIRGEDLDFGYKALKNGIKISYLDQRYFTHSRHRYRTVELLIYGPITGVKLLLKHKFIVRNGKINKMGLLSAFRVFFGGTKIEFKNFRFLLIRILGFYYYLFQSLGKERKTQMT